MAALTGRPTVHGSWQPAAMCRDQGCSRSRWTGASPCASHLVKWSIRCGRPNDDLIVYGGPSVGGQVPLLGVKPDGTPVKLPDVKTGLGGAHRFLPNGTGLVYSPRTQSRDFWLLDLATKTTRPLTRLSDHGNVSAFDITPDGKEIVFDRLRDNSHIVAHRSAEVRARIIAHPCQPTIWRRDTR